MNYFILITLFLMLVKVVFDLFTPVKTYASPILEDGSLGIALEIVDFDEVR